MIERIDHVALSVRDPEASMAWYAEHLGLERRFEGEWEGPPYMVGAGTACLALFPAKAGATGDPAPVRVLHVAFGLGRAAFTEARARLAERGVEVREVEHENCWSLYLADPDGHQLELTTYEPDRPPR